MNIINSECGIRKLPGPLLYSCSILAAAMMIGFSESQPQIAPPQSATVPVSQVVQRRVLEYVDLTGRTDAVDTVSIVPRVPATSSRRGKSCSRSIPDHTRLNTQRQWPRLRGLYSAFTGLDQAPPHP